LKAKDVNRRRLSATLLAQIELVPQSSVPALQAALKDADMIVRVNVATCLYRILLTLLSPTAQGKEERLKGQGQEAVTVLMTALTNKLLRVQAVAALAKAGPQAKEAIPALLRALQDEN